MFLLHLSCVEEWKPHPPPSLGIIPAALLVPASYPSTQTFTRVNQLGLLSELYTVQLTSTLIQMNRTSKSSSKYLCPPTVSSKLLTHVFPPRSDTPYNQPTTSPHIENPSLFLFFLQLLSSVLGIELGALSLINKPSTTRFYSQPHVFGLV